ncbi:MAG: tetratricopeptide repeat-containing sensor histidine kinase [Mucilaginibacter sp.]
MKPFYALFIIFNLVSFNLVAKHQTPTADSLKKLIAPVLRNTSNLPDTLTIGRINKLADSYFESYPDSCTHYGKLEIDLSKKINYLKGIADGTVQVASVNTFKGEYAASGENYATALKLYLQIGNKHGISECYIGLGRVQDYLGNYDKAVSLFNKALAIRMQSGVQSDISDCYNIMGITYDNKGDLPKALDFYFKALIINIKNKDSLAAADNYCNIGVIMQHLELYPKALNYFKQAFAIWLKKNDRQGISTAAENIGEVLMSQKKYDQAIGYLNKASKIFHEIDDQEGISLIAYDLGLYNFYTGHTDIAIQQLNLSLQSAGQNKIKYNKAYAYLGLAQVYNQQKNYNQAYNYATQAQLTANNLRSLNTTADATLQLSKALAGLKKFEQAYTQHELYTKLKDSLNNNETIHKLISYNLEIDFQKKQKDIVNQQRQRDAAYQEKIARQANEIAIYGGVIALLAIMLLIYYNGKRKQQKINRLLAEKNEEIIGHQENLNAQAEKLNELNLLKDRLIGILAHDLRAPISTLRGLFTLMTTDNITSEEFADMIPKVFSKLEHTSDFLDTLLFWINSQVGTKTDNIQNFAMADLVHRELENMEDQLKNKNLSVNINLAGDTFAFADPNSVRIVIHNFLTNAIKFSHRDGVIDITAYTERDKVIFKLKDHGIGMTEEHSAGLFKSQVTSLAGTENEIGTGMGLLFCKDLIQKQQGTIWVKSTLGVGTELGFGLMVGAK